MRIAIGLFALVVLFFASCRTTYINTHCFGGGSTGAIIKGEGGIVTSTLSLNNFTGIDCYLANNVTISYGATQEVKVTGHANIIDRIKTDVTNNLWKLTLENGCYQDYELSIHITIPTLNKVYLRGSGDITINDFSNQNDLEIKLSGSGNITLNSFEGAENLMVSLSGSGSITGNRDISTLNNLNLSLNGSGSYNGFPISANACTVILSGSGSCKLTASNTLNATLSGSGSILYKGSPSITQNITGSGRIVNAN